MRMEIKRVGTPAAHHRGGEEIHQAMSKTPRKPCRYCGHPEATAHDWETIEPGKGEELGLCWNGEICRHDSEAAIDRLQKELNEAHAQIAALREALAIIQAAAETCMDHCFSDGILFGTVHHQSFDSSAIGHAILSARAILSTPPPPVVPLEDVRPLVEALVKIRRELQGCGGNRFDALAVTTEALELPVAYQFLAKHPLS